LAFKPGTDDVRDSPGVEIARQLLAKGSLVTAHDPAVRLLAELPDLGLACDAYQAADQADAAVLVTDWPEFLTLDYEELRGRMRGRLFIDGRNCLDSGTMTRAGFQYQCIGGSRGLEIELGEDRAALSRQSSDRLRRPDEVPVAETPRDEQPADGVRLGGFVTDEPGPGSVHS
jgi:hypothetical protein